MKVWSVLLSVSSTIICCGQNLGDWHHALMVDTNCPRFVFAETFHQGLGDMLDRLFLPLSLIYSHPDVNVTLVVEDKMGETSVHEEKGYSSIIHNILGIPTSILRLSEARQKYHPHEVPIGYNGEFGNFLVRSKDWKDSFPCNYLEIIDVYDSCNGKWCPFHFSAEIQAVVKPLLRATLKTRSKCFDVPAAPLSESVVNIVWHVRSGDVCHHCDDSEYYRGISQFIQNALLSVSIPISLQRNIVVHHKSFGEHIANLFKHVPNVVPHCPDSMEQVVCTFLNSDILIATGSALPSIVAWFTEPSKPILFEDVRTFAVQEKAKYTHVSLESDALHMENGRMVHNNTDDLLRLIDQSQIRKRLSLR